MDDDVARVLSWHMASDMDCVVTLTTEKVCLRSVMNTGVGGAVASWLVRSSPDQAVRVQALAWDNVLCSGARHFTLTVPLTSQMYKWVPGNLMLGVTLRWTSISSRGE